MNRNDRTDLDINFRSSMKKGWNRREQLRTLIEKRRLNKGMKCLKDRCIKNRKGNIMKSSMTLSKNFRNIIISRINRNGINHCLFIQ